MRDKSPVDLWFTEDMIDLHFENFFLIANLNTFQRNNDVFLETNYCQFMARDSLRLSLKPNKTFASFKREEKSKKKL